MQVQSALNKFGHDINGDQRLHQFELNDLGKEAVARGFYELDNGKKVMTPELAERAAHEVDGRFTLRGAAMETFRGFADSMLRPIIERPVQSLVVAAAVAGAAHVVPPLAGAVAVYEAAKNTPKTVKGVVQLVNAVRTGDGDAAESSFRKIVPGFTVLASSVKAATHLFD